MRVVLAIFTESMFLAYVFGKIITIKAKLTHESYPITLGVQTAAWCQRKPHDDTACEVQ